MALSFRAKKFLSYIFTKIIVILNYSARAVFVAQLVEWSLPNPEVRGSNPAISKIYYICVVASKALENGSRQEIDYLQLVNNAIELSSYKPSFTLVFDRDLERTL